MNLPSLPSLGEPLVGGVVALGETEDGQIRSGSWVIVEIERGRAVGVEVSTVPPDIVPTIQRLETLSDTTVPRVIFVAAALRETWEQVKLHGVVGAMDQGEIALDGDESLFIRHLPECLELIKASCHLIP
jgi:hypothetical protein